MAKKIRKIPIRANLFQDAGALTFGSNPMDSMSILGSKGVMGRDLSPMNTFDPKAAIANKGLVGEDARPTSGGKVPGGGAGVGVGQALGVAQGAMGIASSISGMLEAEVPEDVNVSASTSKDALAEQFGNFEGLNLGRNGVMDVAGTTMQGASAGASFGPWGAAIGGAAGLIGGTLGSVFGNKKKRKAEAEYNKRQQNLFIGQERFLDEKSMASSMFNYSALGGNLMAYGGNFGEPLTVFNTGNRHEANPNGGIPQGIGANGKPNLVEEGETKFNNYIYSDRLTIPEDFTSEFGLKKSLKGKTYAEASKKLSKEAKERPNDSISKRGLDANLGRLRASQDAYKGYMDFENDFNEEANNLGMGDLIYAKGGSIHIKPTKRKISLGGELFQDIAQEYACGGKMRTSKYATGGLLDNYYPDGGDLVPNYSLLYGIRDTIGANSPEALRREMGLNNPNFRRENTGFPKGYQDHFGFDQGQQEVKRGNGVGANNATTQPEEIQRVSLDPLASGRFAIAGSEAIPGGLLQNPAIQTVDIPNAGSSNTQATAGRTERDRGFYGTYPELLAPALSSIGETIGAIASKPTRERYGRMNLSGSRLDEDFNYKPIDREYYANRMRDYGRSIDSNIMNLSGGNRATAMNQLMSSAYNTQRGIGDMYFQADRENENRRLTARQMRNQAKSHNARLDAMQQQFNIQTDMQEQRANIMHRAARRNAINQGLQTLAGNIEDLGKTRFRTDQIDLVANPLYSSSNLRKK